MIYVGIPDTQKYQFRKKNELNYKRKTYNPKLELILKVVCDYYGIEVTDSKSKNRMYRTKVARFVYLYFSRLMTEDTFVDIGWVVYRNHATVLHGIKQVQDWKRFDKSFERELKEIEVLLEIL